MNTLLLAGLVLLVVCIVAAVLGVAGAHAGRRRGDQHPAQKQWWESD